MQCIVTYTTGRLCI